MMGAIYRGIPKDLALDLSDKFHLKFFVETGTHVGSTSQWASLHFEKVYTIECNDLYIELASKKFEKMHNISIVKGRSEDVLGEVLQKIDGLALIWLDAHWSNDLGYPKPEVSAVCPILRELKLIRDDGRNHVILVDDASFFGKKDGWPLAQEVVHNLSYSKRHVSFLDDVLVSLPEV